MTTSHVEISPDSKKGHEEVRVRPIDRRRRGCVIVRVSSNGVGWILTDEFAEVVPWISFSLVASIVANIIYQMRQPDRQVGGSDRGQSARVWVTYFVLTSSRSTSPASIGAPRS